MVTPPDASPSHRCNLDDHHLMAFGDVLLGVVEPEQHLRLLYSMVSGVFMYLPRLSSSNNLRAPKPITSPPRLRIGQSRRRRNLSTDLCAFGREPRVLSSLNVKPRQQRFRHRVPAVGA